MLDDKQRERLAFGPTMTRTILTALSIGAALLVAIPACKDDGIGDPCTPEQEYDPSFLGFDEKQSVAESKSFQCRTRVCLVNHFRGRASCPYGQNADGTAPTGSTACTVPGTSTLITGKLLDGTFTDPKKEALVTPQCVDRAADKTVYCSCRCADINGETPSGENFCTCPDGFACTQLFTSIGQGNEGLTGAYCIKSNTEYDPNTACNQGDCDPVQKKCQ